MSLCCFPFFRGSGQKKAQAERCFCCCRNRRKRHHRYPSPSGRRHPQVTEGSPGQAHPGQAPAGVTPGEPHTSCPSSRVCVCVRDGEGQRGMRDAHPVQEQVGGCQKPGGCVM